MAQDKIEQDPTMEEILQSIKRIISDDDTAASGNTAEETPAAPASPVMEKTQISPVIEPESDPENDEVLELTDMVKDDGTIVNIKENNVRDILDDIDDLTKAIEDAENRAPNEPTKSESLPPPAPDNGSLDDILEEITLSPEEPANSEPEMAEPEVTQESVIPEPPVVEVVTEELAPNIEEEPAMTLPSAHDEPDAGLISGDSADATKDAFKKFIDALPAMRPEKIMGGVSTRSGTTIEDLLMEAMRPLLKEWLDNNLPETVERIVREELQRLMPR